MYTQNNTNNGKTLAIVLSIFALLVSTVAITGAFFLFTRDRGPDFIPPMEIEPWEPHLDNDVEMHPVDPDQHNSGGIFGQVIPIDPGFVEVMPIDPGDECCIEVFPMDPESQIQVMP